VTIDHVERRAARARIGCGWSQLESRRTGSRFLPIKDRLDQLEETVQIVRSLFDNEQTTFTASISR